jgi:CDP-4-dehydro-6-deoxyglucose reductase, E1
MSRHKQPNQHFWKLQENALTRADLDALVNFIRSARKLTQGPQIRQFEQQYASWQGTKYTVMVNSGSSANLLLIQAVKEMRRWKDGDEVLVPAVTWPTTVTPVMQSGLRPVFVDANLQDLSFDYDQLERKITRRTRAIFVAHLLGFPADFSRLRRIARARDLVILEDSCESQGATVRGTKVGSLGLAGTFSLYWGHHMTAIEGGLICTNDEELYKLLLLKRSHGLARELPVQYHAAIKAQHPDIDFHFLFLTDGTNFRSTELNAVLAGRQLARLDGFIRIRNRNYQQFFELCQRYPEHLLSLKPNGISSFALPFLLKDKGQKHALQAAMRAAGIESRPLISGNLLRQPFLRSFYSRGEFPNADFLHTQAFYIGNNQFVTAKRMKVLEKLLRQFFDEKTQGCPSAIT